AAEGDLEAGGEPRRALEDDPSQRSEEARAIPFQKELGPEAERQERKRERSRRPPSSGPRRLSGEGMRGCGRVVVHPWTPSAARPPKRRSRAWNSARAAWRSAAVKSGHIASRKTSSA